MALTDTANWLRHQRRAWYGILLLLTGWVSLASPAVPRDAAGGGWLQGGVGGDYFNSTDLSGTPAFSRRDVRIDFDWGTTRKPGGSRSPGFADLGNNNFSARWTGQIMPRFSENYVFKVTATNGARLFIAPTNSSNWVTLLDAWNTPGTYTVTNALAAGQTYVLKLEYHRLATGPGVCRLLWSSPSTPEEVLDTATLAGLNVDTYAGFSYQLWANAMDGARDEWSCYSGPIQPLVPRDTNGWPATDATNIVYEGVDFNKGIGASGTYLLQFQGRAAVSANVFSPIAFVANGTNYGGALPFGAGYNAASNLTTATLTISSNNGGILYLGFQNTRRNPGDTTPTGVSQIKLMRPVSPGSSTNYAPGTYFYAPFLNAVQRYTILRWIANFDTDIEWTNRSIELPAYSTHNNTGSQRYWEQMVMLANESGKDLYVCLPVRASNNYLTNVANLLCYGSDGVNPYTSPQANPVYPPLNPNLRVIMEHENEVWNWNFANAGNNITDLLVACTNNTPDWQVVNYDGAYTSNPSGAWLRWHILRALRASDIFRSVFGDAAMGSRVRMIYEYQYDDGQGTASGALPFIDNYFNNADGTAHVAVPHPVNYYFWGGGGAVYYASGNSDGTQTNLVFANSGFENPVLGAGQAQSNPPGSSWTFTGNAGIYHAAAVTNVWNSALGNSSAPASQAYGCSFTVGASPVEVYELGRWVAAGNNQTHTVYLVDTNKNDVANVSVNTSGAAVGQYVYSPLAVPVVLSANTTYYLVSTENGGGDTFYTNTALTPVAGLLTVNSSASVNTSASGWDPTQWIYSNVQSGAITFGPVNLRYASVPVGTIGYPPDPSEGSQAAFIQGAGTISQTVNFTNPGTFALRIQCASKVNAGNTVRFFYDNTFITPNGSFVTGAMTNQWFPGQGWGHDSRSFGNYSTFVFQVTNAGPHTLTIQGLGVGQYDPVSNPPDTNLVIYFDALEIISADAVFAGGIPGAGQANGQVASDNYNAQLFSQARYAQAYGLQVVAYEGGWSLGGDFGATVFQNWCKFFDPRSATAQLSSINTFARSGSRYYVFGTYETWPAYDTINSGSYPLTQAVDIHNAALPLDPDNGIVVPNVLAPANNQWLFNANAGSSAISGTGGWFYWNILAPAGGSFVITVTNQAGGSGVLEVDGSTQGAPFTSTVIRTNFLTKGLHAIKVRSTGGSFTVTNVTISQIGAPNAPGLQSAVEGDGLVTLSWAPASGGSAAQGYLVNYGLASGNYSGQISVGTVTNWTVTGLTNGVAVYFTVVATNAAGYSLPSNERNSTPVAPGQLRNLLVWDFTAAGGNAASDGSAASVASTTTANGMQAGTITRGAGSPAGALQAGRGLGAMNMNSGYSWIAATLAAAKTAGNYFQFAVAPVSGNQCSLSSVAYVTYQQNSHSTATVVLEYSTNGFATDGVALATNNPVRSDGNGATNIVSLSGISALQNITNTVTFRIWGYGFGPYEDKGLGEIAGNNPDVAVVGTVTFPVAAPVSLSLQTSGSNLQLTWPHGTLLEATNLAGPWTTNTGTSPVTINPSAPQKFFRVSVP